MVAVALACVPTICKAAGRGVVRDVADGAAVAQAGALEQGDIGVVRQLLLRAGDVSDLRGTDQAAVAVETRTARDDVYRVAGLILDDRFKPIARTKPLPLNGSA